MADQRTTARSRTWELVAIIVALLGVVVTLVVDKCGEVSRRVAAAQQKSADLEKEIRTVGDELRQLMDRTGSVPQDSSKGDDVPRQERDDLRRRLRSVSDSFHQLQTEVKRPLAHIVSSTPVEPRTADTEVKRPVSRRVTKSTEVDLGQIANHAMDHLVNPSVGRVTLGGIWFQMRGGENAEFETGNVIETGLPSRGSLRVSIAQPTALHVLVSSAWVVQVRPGTEVGKIVLSFGDGSTYSVPLVAWKNVREPWAYASDRSIGPLDGLPGTTWRNVFVDEQSRDDRPARGFIDMLTVPVPEPYSSKTMVGIEFVDSSPVSSLVVMGVTVEWRSVI